MTTTVIEIDRVPLTFVTAATSDRAELVWRRARDALIRSMPAEVAAAWGTRGDDDDSYIFLGRLEIECAIGSDWPDDRMASMFAERLAVALERESAGKRAVVFADRAEYLSAFLAASIDGDPFRSWWFAALDGHRPLTTSARIRTLVVTEGHTGWAALARLTPQVLQGLIGRLDDADAQAMLDRLPFGSLPPSSAILGAIGRAESVPLPSRSHGVVLGLVELVRNGAGALSADMAAALTGMSAIVDSARGGRLPGAKTGASVLEWCRGVNLSRAEQAAVLALDATEVFEFVASRIADSTEPATPGSQATAAYGFTPFGGALLLVVVLCRSERWARWRDALRAAVVADRADGLAARLALGAVARALDPRRAAIVERDPIVRRVFGLDPVGKRPLDDPETMAALTSALTIGSVDPRPGAPGSLGRMLGASGRDLLADFAHAIPGCEGSSPTYLRTRLLALPVAVNADGSEARLGRAQLDILLGLSGLKRANVVLPDGRRLVLSEEPSW